MADVIRLTEASRFTREADAQFKTRADGDQIFIDGYFSVFNSPYQMWDNVVEEIMPGAFTETLQKDDIRALLNHDTTLVLGRNTAQTLTLREDEHGLFGSILVNPKDQDALNAHARVERKDVTQCSFGFDVLDDFTEKIDGVLHVYIRKVKLYEVSVCTFPAYESTEVVARNAAAFEARRKEARTRIFNAWKTEQLNKLRKE